jgi:hypothetical protein
MELVVLNMFALDDFLGRPPLRVINGVYDFIGSDAATPPALYSDPDHIKFRAKLTKVHAAHYAKGSATNTVEGAMKRMTAAMVIEAKPPIVDLGCGHGDGFEIFASSYIHKRRYSAPIFTISRSVRQASIRPLRVGCLSICSSWRHQLKTLPGACVGTANFTRLSQPKAAWHLPLHDLSPHSEMRGCWT